MMYIYFFMKCVVRWSENSMIFERKWELASRWAKFCEILSHSVRYGMYDTKFHHNSLLSSRDRAIFTFSEFGARQSLDQ